jgi:hypothetical protein
MNELSRAARVSYNMKQQRHRGVECSEMVRSKGAMGVAFPGLAPEKCRKGYNNDSCQHREGQILHGNKRFRVLFTGDACAKWRRARAPNDPVRDAEYNHSCTEEVQPEGGTSHELTMAFRRGGPNVCSMKQRCKPALACSTAEFISRVKCSEARKRKGESAHF